MTTRRYLHLIALTAYATFGLVILGGRYSDDFRDFHPIVFFYVVPIGVYALTRGTRALLVRVLGRK